MSATNAKSLGKLSAAIASVAIISQAEAASVYWDGTGSSWSDAAAWATASGNITPDPATAPGSGDVATFNITGVSALQTVNLNGNQSASGLSFLAGATDGVNLQGGDADHGLTLGTSGIAIASGAGAVALGSSTAGQAVNLTLGGAQSWTNSSANVFTVNNAVSLGSYTLTVNGAGAGGATFKSQISGTGALTINTGATAVTTLAAANGYTGNTTLTTGTLRLANTSAVSASALKLNGGTLQLRSDSSATFTSVSTALSGTQTIDVGPASSGTNQTLSLGAVSLLAGNTLAVSGSSGYTLSLASVAMASGTNTFNVGSANLVTGNVTSSGNSHITKSGSGTWTMNGTVNLNSYPGNLVVSAGTLKMGAANAFSGNPRISLNVNGGTFDLAGYSQTFSRAAGTGGTITNSAASAATLSFDAKDGSTVSTYDGAITDNAAGGGVLNLTVSPGGNLNAANLVPVSLTLTSAASTYTGVTTIVGGNPASATKNMVTTLFASRLADGGIASSIGAASSAAGNLVLDYGASLRYTGSGASSNRLFSIGKNYGGFIDSSGSGALGMTGTGAIGFNAATGARYLALTGSNAGDNTFAPTVGDNSGATTLVKAGAGAWRLTNSANTFTGATIVGGGTLNIPNIKDGALASSIGASSSAAANLVLSGGTLQYTGASDQSTNRLFTIAATGGTLDSSGTGTLSFTNSGANVSSDPGSRTYFTGNTQASVTFVQSSMLALDLLPGMTVTGGGLAAGATINTVSSPTSVTFSSVPGTWGTETFNFGTANRTLRLTGSNTGNNSIAGSLSNSAGGGVLSLAKTGAGMWSLSGVSTYTGATTVSAGTLRLHGASLASNISVSAGTLDGAGGSTAGSITIGDATGSGDALLAPGESIGTLEAGGALLIYSDGILKSELNTTTLAADLVRANGVTLGAGAQLNLSDLNPAVLSTAAIFTLVDNTSASAVSGFFLGYSEGSAFSLGGNQYAISYQGGTGNDIILTAIIPEPTSAIAVALGLLSFTACRRRRA